MPRRMAEPGESRTLARWTWAPAEPDTTLADTQVSHRSSGEDVDPVSCWLGISGNTGESCPCALVSSPCVTLQVMICAALFSIADRCSRAPFTGSLAQDRRTRRGPSNHPET